MALYTLRAGGSVVRSDGAVIPPDAANMDYAAYLAWVAAGNTPDPIPSPPAEITRFRTKFLLYTRMTDDELATLDTFLRTTATVRQRLSWTDALEIDCIDPQIVGFASALFGAGRAAEILR